MKAGRTSGPPFDLVGTGGEQFLSVLLAFHLVQPPYSTPTYPFPRLSLLSLTSTNRFDLRYQLTDLPVSQRGKRQSCLRVKRRSQEQKPVRLRRSRKSRRKPHQRNLAQCPRPTQCSPGLLVASVIEQFIFSCFVGFYCFLSFRRPETRRQGNSLSTHSLSPNIHIELSEFSMVPQVFCLVTTVSFCKS
jgi:hypothetical protein